MKIHLVSDMHMEFWPTNEPWSEQLERFPGGEVLILAGDIFVARTLDKLNNPESTYYKQSKMIIDFISDLCSRYNHVMMVMGNHEHYSGTFEKTAGLIRKNLAFENFYLLNNESVEVDGVTFYGGTLWTDCGGDVSMYGYQIEYYMNDYRAIKTLKEGYRRLRARDTCLEHSKFLLGLRHATKDAEKLVVVGHHAPSQKSVHMMYQRAGVSNYAYFSHLEKYIHAYKPVLWVHGHMHTKSDYMIDETRVVANPFGYHGHEVTFNNLEIKEIEI